MEKNRTNVVYAQQAKAYKGNVRGLGVLSRLRVTNVAVKQINDDYRVLSISGNIYGDQGIKQVSKALGETELKVNPEYNNVSISINKAIKSEKQEEFLTKYIVKGATLTAVTVLLSVNDGYLNGQLLGSADYIEPPKDSTESTQSDQSASQEQDEQPIIDISDDDLPF